jgi:carbon monoxide dehydrogenase subunit G
MQRRTDRSHRTAIWRTALIASVAALLSIALPPETRAAEEPTALTVTRGADGVFHVQGHFSVAAPRAVAWAVLTDYANLPAFVSSLRSSTVTTNGDGGLTVSQQAVGKLGPFSRSLHVTLRVVETDRQRIRFQDLSGSSFSSYVGTWEIAETASGVRVSYDLLARPLSAPPFFGRSILGKNARDLLDQVRVEMLRRSVRAAAR